MQREYKHHQPFPYISEQLPHRFERCPIHAPHATLSSPPLDSPSVTSPHRMPNVPHHGFSVYRACRKKKSHAPCHGLCLCLAFLAPPGKEPCGEPVVAVSSDLVHCVYHGIVATSVSVLHLHIVGVLPAVSDDSSSSFSIVCAATTWIPAAGRSAPPHRLPSSTSAPSRILASLHELLPPLSLLIRTHTTSCTGGNRSKVMCLFIPHHLRPLEFQDSPHRLRLPRRAPATFDRIRK
jgi:hypothetical protein